MSKGTPKQRDVESLAARAYAASRRMWYGWSLGEDDSVRMAREHARRCVQALRRIAPRDAERSEVSGKAAAAYPCHACGADTGHIQERLCGPCYRAESWTAGMVTK